MTRRGLLGGALGAIGAGTDPASALEGRPVLYKGMTLVDGPGPTVRADMAVITQGERIDMVFPAKQLKIMRLAPMEVVDAKDLTALPGLTSTVEEIKARVGGGQSLKQAILSTLGGRRIRPGVVADLVFLHGNPLEDSAALSRVAFTLKRGVRSTGTS